MRAVFCCAALVAALLMPGCSGQPSADDRENHRVLDQVLTAITLKNVRLLDEGAQRVSERHAAAQISAQVFERMQAFIQKARNQDWAAAEAEGNAFRRSHPFIPAGQR